MEPDDPDVQRTSALPRPDLSRVDRSDDAIPVVVVGDVRFYREGLARFLDDRVGFVVIGTAATLPDAIALLVHAERAIVLLDVVWAEDAAWAREIAAAVPGTRVLALGVPEIERDVLAVAESGVVGFVGRDRSLADLVVAIEAANRDEFVCSAATAASLLQHVGRLAAGRQRPPVEAILTRRELEIVALLEVGLSNKQIAGQLSIEVATVKNHVHHVLEKLDVRRRGEIVAARRSEIARPRV